jgi:hypothetical protein
MIERNVIPVKEWPILFSGPMVLAIQANRKHVTRRLSKQWLKVKAGDKLWVRETWRPWSWHDGEPITVEFQADGGRVEDLCGSLAEHQLSGYEDWYERIAMQATDECANAVLRCALGVRHDGEEYHWDAGRCPLKWHPNIFLPRWCSRILLECEEDARLERLQDITDEEAVAEGVAHGEPDGYVWIAGRAINKFRSLWSSLHTKPGERWTDDPQVVRVGRFRSIALGSRGSSMPTSARSSA